MIFGRRRADPLPGLNAVRITTFGWDEVERTERGRVWAQGADILSLDYLPAKPTISGPVGDDAKLLEYFERYAAEDDVGVVEARWITAEHETPVTWMIAKAPMPAAHGCIYIGSLIVPFAACSWVAKIQSREVGYTGMREALWFDFQLRQSDSPEDTWAALTTKSDDGSNPRASRRPSDDEAWDDIVPGHPLSRVRTQLLPQIAASIEISPAARRLAAFAGPGS
jgi:hypothetical protein